MPRERYLGTQCGSLQLRAVLQVAARERTTQNYNPFITPHHAMAQSDEEDDYMNMVFEDVPKGPKHETSLQRAARKRKEVRLLALLNHFRLT
jgi:hypothetical protein